MRTLVWIIGVVVLGLLALSFGLFAVRAALGLFGIGDEPARIIETGTLETVP